MRLRVSQTGFSIVEVLIILVVVGILGFVGYSVYERQGTQATNTAATPKASTTPKTNSDTNEPADAPQINSTSDLDKAADVLDQTDTDSDGDSAALDSELQAF